MRVQRISIPENSSVLFVQLRAMGDAILTTPFLRDFKTKYPTCKVDILVEPLPAKILTGNPHLNEIIVAPQSGSSVLSYSPLIRTLRSKKYNLAIDFLSTPGSALLTRLTGAYVRIGYKLRCRRWAYTHPAKRRATALYNPLTKYDLGLGLDIIAEDTIPEIFIPAEKKNNIARIWDKYEFGDKIVIAFAPWSKRAWRRWDNSKWIKFIKEIVIDKPVTWLMFATETEKTGLQDILDKCGSTVKWVGMNEIMDTAALINRCKLFVGADNGLKHISVALKVPSLTIFIGSDPHVWHPPDDDRHYALDFREHLQNTDEINVAVSVFKNLIER